MASDALTWQRLLDESVAKGDTALTAAKARLFTQWCDDVPSGPVAEQATIPQLSTLMMWARVAALDVRELYERLGAPAMPMRQVNGTPCATSRWLEQKATKYVRRWLITVRAAVGDASPLASMVDAHLATVAAASLAIFGAENAAVVPPQENDSAAAPAGNAVAVVPSEDGSGDGSLRLARPVAPFGEILRIPARELFNVRTVIVHSELGRVLAQPQFCDSLDPTGEALLLATLIFEQDVVGAAKSHWRLMLEHCPKTFAGVPTEWPGAVVAELAGTSLLDEVLAKRERLALFASSLTSFLTAVVSETPSLLATLKNALMERPQCFASAETACGEDGDADADAVAVVVRRVFSEARMQWARCVMDSRAFHLNYDGDVLLTMAHTADMINHDAAQADIITRRIDAGTGDFVLEAAGGLGTDRVGQELLMSYGPLQNWELLLSYGFVLEENPYDTLPVPIAFDFSDDDDCAYNIRRRTIAEEFHLDLFQSFWIPATAEVPPALHASLRLAMAEAEEFEALERSPFEPLSAETEGRIMETLACVAGGLLEGFDDTIDDDETEIAAAAPAALMTDPRLLAVRCRLGIKRIARALTVKCGGATATAAADDDDE